MTITQRICQVFATVIVLIVIFGTMIDCAGLAGKVAVTLMGVE